MFFFWAIGSNSVKPMIDIDSEYLKSWLSSLMYHKKTLSTFAISFHHPCESNQCYIHVQKHHGKRNWIAVSLSAQRTVPIENVEVLHCTMRTLIRPCATMGWHAFWHERIWPYMKAMRERVAKNQALHHTHRKSKNTRVTYIYIHNTHTLILYTYPGIHTSSYIMSSYHKTVTVMFLEIANLLQPNLSNNLSQLHDIIPVPYLRLPNIGHIYIYIIYTYV